MYLKDVFNELMISYHLYQFRKHGCANKNAMNHWHKFLKRADNRSSAQIYRMEKKKGLL